LITSSAAFTAISNKDLDRSVSELQKARDSREDVIDFIIQDLREAIDMLPAFKNIAASDEGRVSREAAQAFLSRVALYEGTWLKSRNGNQNTERSMRS